MSESRLVGRALRLYSSDMRLAGCCAGVLGCLSFVVVAKAEPLVSSSSTASALPIAVASFPAEPSSVAAVHVDLASTPDTTVVAPASSTPASQSVPAQPASDDASYCVESPTALELGALALVRMIEDGAGLFAVAHVFTPSEDEQAFDNAAAKELRRITFMRKLAQMHDAENEREFSEKLSLSLRKREFLQGLESTRQLSPNPFGSDRR